VFPAHDGKFWDKEDWANWRRRIWQGRAAEPATTRNAGRAAQPGAAPGGTRPRDLRSSYVTLRVYEGVPLTTISREVGTSVLMIERHYAGVIENSDGQRVPAEAQIRATRAANGRGMDVLAIRGVAFDDVAPWWPHVHRSRAWCRVAG
jgi:hypothetical protein